MNRGLAVVSAVLSVVVLSACASGGPRTPPAADKPPPPVSRLGTVGPVPVGQWVSAGPYEVRLDGATVTASSSVRDLYEPRQFAGGPRLKSGQRLAMAWVSVRNSLTSSGAVLPAPDIADFRLVDEKGKVTPTGGVGLSRSGSLHSDPPKPQGRFAQGTGMFMSSPMNPGETFQFSASFTVPASAKRLTLVRSLATTPSPVTVLLTVK